MAQLEDGERTSDPKRVAEALGNYFQAFARVRTDGEDYLVLGAKENLEALAERGAPVQEEISVHAVEQDGDSMKLFPPEQYQHLSVKELYEDQRQHDVKNQKVRDPKQVEVREKLARLKERAQELTRLKERAQKGLEASKQQQTKKPEQPHHQHQYTTIDQQRHRSPHL